MSILCSQPCCTSGLTLTPAGMPPCRRSRRISRQAVENDGLGDTGLVSSSPPPCPPSPSPFLSLFLSLFLPRSCSRSLSLSLSLSPFLSRSCSCSLSRFCSPSLPLSLSLPPVPYRFHSLSQSRTRCKWSHIFSPSSTSTSPASTYGVAVIGAAIAAKFVITVILVR